MAIHRASLANTAFIVGAYDAAGSGVAGPALRMPGTGAVANFDGSEENDHFTVNTATYSYSLNAHKPGAKIVKFGPPGGTNNCYYLPFKQNNITSIRIGTAADTFFTDNLSGCSVFIDSMPGGDLVVYHANRQGMSYTGTAQQRMDASFERQVAVAVKHAQHDNAQRATYGTATPQGSLFKSRYMTNAARHENVQRFVGQGDTTIYGTTVVGFLRGGSWRFWYQTWRADSGGNTYAVINSEQFWP